ncbi:TPA: translational GTPase TypA [Candidatus Taylorbacteria bacterium]|nr:translational GTPase TypA [Candidatus Taylorbacteria bacterium]
MQPKEIRNIAIIAHVDHGKTTLTDALMQQNGGIVGDAITMDTNPLEQERGITIYAKNTSIYYKDTKINIVDTPGHADFGSEVERVLRAIDTVLLIVDAQEGPMPQTRFVLKKSLELGLKPIVVINKIDKPAANPEKCHDEILELFMDLGANDEQLDFKTVYAIGREGVAMKKLTDERKDLGPLLDTILESVPPAKSDTTSPARAQVFNLGIDNFVGRLAICRIYEGIIKIGETIYLKKTDGTTVSGRITKLFTFEGLQKKEVTEAVAGDIIMLAGFPTIEIGETLTERADQEALPTIKVDEPTISIFFLVNDSPFAGREGKFVTTRQIKDRLEKELEINVGLKVDFSDPTAYKVFGRGELHIAILVENMRREGFELQISQPKVIIKEVDGQKMEPFEELIIDVPTENSGVVIEKVGRRKGIMHNMTQHNNTTRIVFEIPTRGLLGYRGQFIIDTRGEGIMSSRFIEFRPYAGEIEHKDSGSMISMENGKAVAFALWNLSDRGTIYILPGTEIYTGMVIGNTSKGEEMMVNPSKGKQLSNMRSSGNDEHIMLTPPTLLSIESGMETMSDDEYLEITPTNVRLRKKHLSDTDRARASRGMKKES